MLQYTCNIAILTHAHACMHAHARAHTHAHTQTHAHKHTHAKQVQKMYTENVSAPPLQYTPIYRYTYFVSLLPAGVKRMRYPELHGSEHITSATSENMKSDAGQYLPFLTLPKVSSSS